MYDTVNTLTQPLKPCIFRFLEKSNKKRPQVRWSTFAVYTEHGRHFEIGHLESKSTFLIERGRVIYQITPAFSAKFIPVNRFEVAVMVQKLQHILLQVTEDCFDHGGEN